MKEKAAMLKRRFENIITYLRQHADSPIMPNVAKWFSCPLRLALLFRTLLTN